MIVAVSTTGSGKKTSNLPPGAWGKTIACLEGNGSFEVTQMGSQSAASPTKHTTAIDLTDELHGYSDAAVEHTASHAAAEAVEAKNGLFAPTANYYVSGSTVWALTEGGDSPHILASGYERQDIASCIQNP